MPELYECLGRVIKARKKYDEFNELSEKCLSVFGPPWLSLDTIHEIVGDDWRNLYNKFHVYGPSGENIWALNVNLQSAMINRIEFEEGMKGTIAAIEEKGKKIKKELEEAERNLSLAYDEFFKKDPKTLDGNEKSIYLILNQPDAKKIIRKFLLG